MEYTPFYKRLLAHCIEVYPSLSLKKYEQIIQEYYNKLKVKLTENISAIEKLKILESFLFNNRKYKLSVFQGYPSPDYFSLNRVIDEKTGSCLGLCLLFLSIIDLLHLPIFGILSPKHMLLIYDDDKIQKYIDFTDPTSGIPQYYFSQAEYFSKISCKTPYLKKLSHNELIAVYLVNRAVYIHVNRGFLNNAVQDINRALELFPDYSYAYYNRSIINIIQNNTEMALKDLHYSLKLDPLLKNIIYPKMTY